jgi:hypothetical protein
MVEAPQDVDGPDDELWDVIQYHIDKKRQKHWVRIGRAWRKPDVSMISIRLFALPVGNAEGEILFNLVPR